MATRSRTSFKKRQKEIARMEKQRDKAAKRLQRKLAGKEPEAEETPLEPEETSQEEAVEPQSPPSGDGE